MQFTHAAHIPMHVDLSHDFQLLSIFEWKHRVLAIGRDNNDEQQNTDSVYLR